jgi:hypothetical protein
MMMRYIKIMTDGAHAQVRTDKTKSETVNGVNSSAVS